MITLPAKVLEATFHELAACGRGNCECVCFWTGPADERGRIDGWVHPVHHRSQASYMIDDAWLTRFCFELGRSRRSILAQVHTHPGLAFHSLTDARWPVASQPGFISVVIPNFASGQSTLDRTWIGVVTDGGGWRRVGAEHVFRMVS